MEGQKTTIRSPEDGSEKDFLFDRCYWSHDNSAGHTIFTNADLFEDVGNELLSNAYNGFNATIFAYGQTGSGKSYSIEGAGGDRGLLQRICESLF